MNSTIDTLLASLLESPQDAEAHALAARYAPILRFDDREPFLPQAAGYTIFRKSAPSPSFRQSHKIDLTSADSPDRSPTCAIEYAIWWDWDIGHLYELEHVWVFVNAHNEVVRCEASWHGDYHDMRHEGRLNLQDTHVILYSEPGKHAFAPTPDWFKERAEHFKRSETKVLAGCSGVLSTPYTEDRVTVTPLKNRLVHTYLAQQAFEPSWNFSQYFKFIPEMLVPWEALRDWIPSQVNDWLIRLAEDIPPSDYRFLRIGHRGARAHAPDNTLSSLRKAAELGADMVEFDVQLTADHHAVVVHDVYLTDKAGHVWPIRASMLEELQAIDLGGGEHVPTLSEALEICQEENMGAYIELKDGAAVASVIEAVREYEMQSHSIIGSFRPDWLAELKAISSKMTTSILFSFPKLDAVKLAQAIGATYVHPCWERYPHPSILLTPTWIRRVREAGLGIICWHEERPEEITALRQLGVDGICSDAPELLLSKTPKAEKDPGFNYQHDKRVIA